MTVREILSILLWPMALFIVVCIDSWWRDWGVFGKGNTMLERIFLVLSILAYILITYVGSFCV